MTRRRNWSLGFAYLGLAFGGAAIRLLHFTHRLDVRLGFVALLLMIILFFVTRRRRIAERTARVLTGENIAIMTTAEREMPSRWRSRRVEKS